MRISRRDFLKYCVSSAAILGLDATVLGKLEKALAANAGPHVLWLSGSACTGCTVSLANRISTSAPTNVADLLINVINLDFHPNLMGAAGDDAVQALRTAAAGSYILVVEGGIPAAFGGNACVLWNENGTSVTALDAVRDLASRSIANIAVGTCASFGGVAAAAPNPTQVTGLSTAIGRQAINISGCPVHPDWIVWAIAQLLAGVTPALDSSGRPSALFSSTVHDRCPRRHDYEDNRASTYGRYGCLYSLGCEGPRTRGDCPTRRWNNGVSFCVNANAPCYACTQNGFPDSFSPLLNISTTSTIPTQKSLTVSSAIWDNVNGVLNVAGTGKIGSQAVVKDPAGELIAATMIKRDGNWTAAKAGLSSVPASVAVLSNGTQVTANVTGAPAGLPFAITSAAYSSGTNQLAVSGTGQAGAEVTVSVTGGDLLGAVTIPANGSWALTVTSPTPVPANVTAQSNGVTLAANVTGIPVPITFAILTAAYTVGNNQLSVTGRGPVGANVTVSANSAALGNATIASNGQWSVTATSPSPVPTSVSAVCNGVTLTANVTGIPAPSQTLAITRADYNSRYRRLYLAGAGTRYKSVRIYNDSTGAYLGSAFVGYRGTWSRTLYLYRTVPTRVRVTSNNETAERDVARI